MILLNLLGNFFQLNLMTLNMLVVYNQINLPLSHLFVYNDIEFHHILLLRYLS